MGETTMASIRRQIVIDADPDAAWDALRDWEALHVWTCDLCLVSCRFGGCSDP
jgi:hypothetical protein